MIKNYLKLTMLSFILFPSITYAICSEQDKAEFESVKDEYTVTYEYDFDTKTYDITFESPLPKRFGYLMKYKTSNNEFSIKLYEKKLQGIVYKNLEINKYTIEIVGVSNTCNDVLETIELDLKAKNKYANDPLCDNLKDFALCQEYYDRDIDYDTFVSRIEAYKRQKENNTNSSSRQEKNESIDFFENHLIHIIIITTFVLLAIITIIVMLKANKKRRRLE